MSKTAQGILGPSEGIIGPVETYKRRGVGVMRARRRKSKKNKKGSELQIACRQNLKLVNVFISPLTAFVRFGFDLQAAPTVLTANNMAKSYQMHNALKGEYPNVEIDYSKARLTSGLGRPADNPAVVVNENCLTFTWDICRTWPDWSDMVMLAAYVPEIKDAEYELCGAKRLKGTEDLELPKSWKGKVIETYISFRAADGKSIANSTYVGSIIF